MINIWGREMCIGDLVMFDDEFYKNMKSVCAIKEIGIITEIKEMFYCISSGEVHDLWVSFPDIKKINLDKLLK